LNSEDSTFENDQFEWTESSGIINDALPPSFSASYLYIRDKSKGDTLLVPGICLIHSTKIQNRDPDVYICAVKCANENNLNFLYSKTSDIEDFFKGRKARYIF
jgi:hypothetical protein